MNIRKFFLLSALVLCSACAIAEEVRFTSPDGRLNVQVSTDGGRLQYSVSETIHGTESVYAVNSIGMQFEGVKDGKYLKPSKVKRVGESFKALNYKLSDFRDEYNVVEMRNSNGINVEFRAYNSGVAYRFFTTRFGKKEWRVNVEQAEFRFTSDHVAYLPYSTNEKNPKAMAFQATYDVAPLSQSKSLEAFLPATVDCHTAKVTIMETDVEAYPGMFLLHKSGKGAMAPYADKTLEGLVADFARYPKTFDYYPWRVQKYVKETEDFIACGKGDRTFPWRILAITHSDTEMPVNTLAYQLASPSRIGGDLSWIRPGKVAWDWWNDWGISGVPFKAGINQDTYKYYIDFASRQGLEYVVLDEGWYEPKSGDMLTVIPQLNLPELVDYARGKGVGIILWTVFNVLDRQLEESCETYSRMGIKGFKVDFLDRYDQEGVDMIYRIAERCAKSHLMLDYHGIFAPQGITRTYPNVVNFEAVFGMEEVKWTERETVTVDGRNVNQPSKDMPLYDVTFPFIRGMVGSTDFTPGGMRNATKADFQPVYNNPMTMGTRCHQMAHYIVHESPLTMLADNPTAYMRNQRCTDFISSLPTVFDRMLCTQGEMGRYIVIARQKGDRWYLAGETNWDARTLQLDLSFLPEGDYQMELFQDGPNAGKDATDYSVVSRTVSRTTRLDVAMASGGGFAMKLQRK